MDRIQVARAKLGLETCLVWLRLLFCGDAFALYRLANSNSQLASSVLLSRHLRRPVTADGFCTCQRFDSQTQSRWMDDGRLHWTSNNVACYDCNAVDWLAMNRERVLSDCSSLTNSKTSSRENCSEVTFSIVNDPRINDPRITVSSGEFGCLFPPGSDQAAHALVRSFGHP